MRNLLITAALFVTAAPAFAQAAYDDGAADALPDTRQVDRAAGMLDRLVGAVMELPIGGVVAVVDPEGRSGYGPGATVRDMASRDDPDAERRLRQSIHGTARGVDAMTRAFALAVPALRRSVLEIERSMAQAVAEAESER